MSNIVLSSLLIISSILLSNLAIYGIRKKQLPGAFVFSILIIAMVIDTVGCAFELLGTTIEVMYFWIRIEYIGGAFYPFLVMLFAREYSDEKKFANKYILTLILTVNLITLILVNTNSYHYLYYSSIGIDSSLGFNILALEKGIWYFVQMSTLYLSFSYSIITFIVMLVKSRDVYRKRITFVLIGMLIPMLALTVYMLGLGPSYIDLVPFSYLFMSLFIVIGLFKYDTLFFRPITHEMIFNSIDEAVLVVDKDQILVNFNNAAKYFFPSLNNMKIGQSILLVRELKNYDFTSNHSMYKVNDKILNFKVIEIEKYNGKIYVVNDITESEKTKKQLQIFATEDALTGLYNRRYFMENFEKTNNEGVFVIIDIDNFKAINDTYGHIHGDNVLSFFGNALKTFFKDDMACRYGGEEFAVFIKHVDIGQAFKKLETFRIEIESDESSIKLTFSAGLAEHRKGNISKTIIRADNKLYVAKQNGRNQVRY